MISSRTPEGWPNRCAVCGREVRVEPSAVPVRDAVCPHCGSLVRFGKPPELWVPAAVLDREGLDAVLAEWERAGRPGRVVLDFAGVGRLASAAVGRLIRLHQRLRPAGVRLALVHLNPAVIDVLRTARLDDQFEIGPD